MEYKKLISIFILSMFLISLVSAEIDWTPKDDKVKQGECIMLDQSCDTCTYVNITYVSYPNNTGENVNYEMTKEGTKFFYNFCNTSLTGTYHITLQGDKDSTTQNEEGYFEVTPDGFILGSGNGTTLIGSLFLMVIVSLILLFVAVKSENKVMKITFYVLFSIIMIMSILYTVVIIQQTLYGFESIQSGIETFWFVIKMLIGVGVIAFFIVIILILVKLFKIKRGLYDE
ncbi:MAG: hypothetical protein WC758_08275 [Candidatus Woesearchaeota archaeon]|jgi:hypothetical protein